MDGPEASAVTGGHVGVEGLDGVRPGHLTVLPVHVVGAGAGVVTDPDTEVLDLLGVLLADLNRRKLEFFLFHFDTMLTALTLTISPVAFLTLRRPRKKYQKRDLATVVLGAKMVMRYISGVGFASVGR